MAQSRRRNALNDTIEPLFFGVVVVVGGFIVGVPVFVTIGVFIVDVVADVFIVDVVATQGTGLKLTFGTVLLKSIFAALSTAIGVIYLTKTSAKSVQL